MIIKSHIRGGYRAAADYMKDIGKNEKTRLVELSDPSAQNLDDAFENMWVVASCTRCKKPLHHISINPMKDERLTDKQVLAIADRCEEKYSYKLFEHQRVIVEHIRDGRQHFHVIWNRVNMKSVRPIWPGKHWNKSREIAREMEKELGLKRPSQRRSGKGRPRRIKGKALPHKVEKGFTQKPLLSRHEGIFYQTSYKPKPKTNDETKLIPLRPTQDRKGWPEAAVIDWEVWGHLFPRRFFIIWPELAKN